MSDCLYNWQQVSDRFDSLSTAIAQQHITILEALQQKANEINGNVDFRINELSGRIPGYVQMVIDNNNVYWQGKYNELWQSIADMFSENYTDRHNAYAAIQDNIDMRAQLIMDEVAGWGQQVSNDLTEVINNLLDIKDKIGTDPESKTIQEKLIDSLVKIGEVKIALDNVNIGVNGNSFKLNEINGKQDEVKDMLDLSGVVEAMGQGMTDGQVFFDGFAGDEINSAVLEYQQLGEDLPVPIEPGPKPVPINPENALVVIGYNLMFLTACNIGLMKLSLLDFVQDRSHNLRHKKFNNESYLPWLFFKALGLEKDEYTESSLQILPWGTDSILIKRLKEGGLQNYFKVENGIVKWEKAIPFLCQTGQTEYLTDVFFQSLALWPAWRV